MPKKIKHTKKQVSMFIVHLIVYLVASAAMWFSLGPNDYPWPAWVIATWGLMVVGHACTIWYNYEDRGMDEFKRQLNN
ncbi:MAG: 2TM domain-containing protein [Taibaiella sp.]|nr:2TM domain-containing protein [Taibaiella sp.]